MRSGQLVEGGDCPLCSAPVKPPLECCVQVWAQSQKGCGALRAGPEEGQKVDQRDGAPLL